MPLKKRSRIRQPYSRTLDLPPSFRPVMLREVGDAFAHACANAAELGAGALVFVGRFDLAEFAVVLEPDEPIASARRVFYAGMVALGDAFAVTAPPEKPMAIEWPDAIYVDRGLIGGGRLRWPDCADERAAPEWLVFGAAIRTVNGEEPRHLVEGFARHLMVAIDRWHEGGFAAIAKDYISKLKSEQGERREIDENGDLEIRRAGQPIARRKLLPALKAPSWLDPRTGGPRL
jgi:Biotin/lipoate A/B protein ligase family